MHLRRALPIADALIVTVLGGLLVTLAVGQVHSASLHLSPTVWVAGVCVAVLSVRAVVGMLAARQEQRAEGSGALSRGSYGELIRGLPAPLSTLIENSTEIQILGGTMIELVRQEDALKALSVALSRGSKVEIIMLDPEADILRTIAAERAERSNASALAIHDRLKGECEFSLERLLAIIPSGAVDRVLRLSTAMPHHAFSRYGNTYLLTTYTFARGGSGPSTLFRKTPANEPLCAGLTRGFAELWTSRSVRPPDLTGSMASMQSD